MRIDKFLKNSRIIKRREVAKQASLSERIKLNGKIAKPGSNVEVGDIIEISFAKRNLKIKVLDLLESSNKKNADLMYEVIDEKI